MSSSPESPPQQPLIPGLPDHVAIHILACLPLASHSTFAHVSRSWRSILRSPSNLLDVRSHQTSFSERFLCLNVSTSGGIPQSQWFLVDPLRQKRRTLPSPPLPTGGAAVAVLSRSLFVLGGHSHGLDTCAVQILDPLRGIWTPGPSMSVNRSHSGAAAINGRLYVLGGCSSSCNAWAEVLNSSSAWDRVESPPDMRRQWIHSAAVLDGRILALSSFGGVSFDPSRSEWEAAPGLPAALDVGFWARTVAMGGLLYWYKPQYSYHAKILGYDPKEARWLPVEGKELNMSLLGKFLWGAMLVDFGEVLCLVWVEVVYRGRARETQILCAGIRIERSSDGGLRGSIVWPTRVLLTVPEGSIITQCLSLEA